MMRFKYLLAVFAAVGLYSSAAHGWAGDPDYNLIRSEPLTVMEIELADVRYDFTGSAEIPFVLGNSRAHIWLVVYTKDQETPGGWGGATSPIAPNGAVWRKPGIPNAVTVVDKGQFEVGAHTITWDGTDSQGEAVEPGNYALYVIGLNDQDDVNLVAVMGNNGMRYGMSDVVLDKDGQGWYIGVMRGFEGKDQHNNIMYSKLGENNFFENPQAYQAVWIPNAVIDWTLRVNPDNILEGYGCSYHDNPDKGPVDDNGNKLNLGSNQQGIGAWVVADDFSSAMPMPTFGDENGQVPTVSANVNKFTNMAVYGNKIWLSHGGWGQTTPQAEVIVMDAQTGAIERAINVDEWFTTTGVDVTTGNEVTGANTIGWIYTNDSGIWLGPMAWSGDVVGSDAPNRGADFGLFMKMDFDGNPIWINENGDGFGDQITEATANALGMSPVFRGTQMGNGSSSGFILINEEALGPIQDSFGALIGPDGTGILHVRPAKSPAGHESPDRSGADMIAEGSDYDGIYAVVMDVEYGNSHGHADHNQLVHMPFRIAEATIGNDVMTAVEEQTSGARPESATLVNIYPNPFNSEVTLDFTVANEGPAIVAVYNQQGQLVKTLVNKTLPVGSYRVHWDGTDVSGQSVASGVYTCRLVSGLDTDQRKVALIK